MRFLWSAYINVTFRILNINYFFIFTILLSCVLIVFAIPFNSVTKAQLMHKLFFVCISVFWKCLFIPQEHKIRLVYREILEGFCLWAVVMYN